MPTSDSSELFRLTEFLTARGISFISSIQASRTPRTDFVLTISVDHIAETAEIDKISERQMRLLQAAVKSELGLSIEWMVTPSQRTSSIESALLELIELRFPQSISAVFISALNRLPVSVWLERNPKNPSQPEVEDIKIVIDQFLQLYGIADFSVTDGGKNLPITPVILRKLKTHAPVTTDALAEILQSFGFFLPNSRWLQRSLDKLRKDGFVIRSKTGDYCLTEKALGVVPRSRNRTSSDIERALALGRRRW